jgi:hypothetical protein
LPFLSDNIISHKITFVNPFLKILQGGATEMNMPKKQINHKYINNSIDQWLDIHFGDTSFNGRAVIGYRRNGGGIYTMSARSLTELRPYIKMIHASPRMDYYITANTVSGTSRHQAKLFGLQNIVIDIDCHDGSHHHNVSALVQAFIWRSKRDLFEGGVIPYPNSIVRTGRGVQLWWAIVPCYGQRDVSLYHYNKIKNNFMDHIESMLDEYQEELDGLNVDRGASSNPVGYFRIPCTYNTTAKCYGSIEIIHDQRYDQRELTKLDPIEDDSESSEQPGIALTESDRFILKNFQSTGSRRVLQLIKLRNLRDNEVGSEMRDHFNFSVYNALRMKCDHREAMVHLRAFNAGFKKPMTDRELANCISTAEKKGGYKYTNQRLIEFLAITPEEQSAIGLLPFRSNRPARPNASRDEARKALRDDRDSKILSLAKKGVAQAEIARILGIGKNTVWRVVKRLREMLDSIPETLNMVTENGDGNSRHHFGSLYVLLRNMAVGKSVSKGEALLAIPIGDST